MNLDTFIASMPGLSRARAEQYLEPNLRAQREYNITSERRSRMWLAQVGHESVSLVYFEEIASGSAYEGRTDLGNTQPGDGVRFKGRGPIQITGRANYTAAARALNLDLVNNPGLAANPQHAFRVSAWWWATHGVNELSDRDDVVAATRRINGGLNGLQDRQNRWNRIRGFGAAVVVGGAPAPPPKPEEAEEDVITEVLKINQQLHQYQASADTLWHWWSDDNGGKWHWERVIGPSGAPVTARAKTVRGAVHGQTQFITCEDDKQVVWMCRQDAGKGWDIRRPSMT